MFAYKEFRKIRICLACVARNTTTEDVSYDLPRAARQTPAESLSTPGAARGAETPQNESAASPSPPRRPLARDQRAGPPRVERRAY